MAWNVKGRALSLASSREQPRARAHAACKSSLMAPFTPSVTRSDGPGAGTEPTPIFASRRASVR